MKVEKKMKKSKRGIIIVCLTLLLGVSTANSQAKPAIGEAFGGAVLGEDIKPIELDKDYFKQSVLYYRELADDPSAELTSELRDLIKSIAKDSISWEEKLSAIEQAVFAYWAKEPWCIRDLAKFEDWIKNTGNKILPIHSLAVIGDMLSDGSACSERFWRVRSVAEFYQPDEISTLYNIGSVSSEGASVALRPIESMANKVAQAKSAVAKKVQSKKKKITPGFRPKPCKPGRPTKPNPNRPSFK